MLEHISTVVRRPRLLKRHKNIFLLSHMRANTSLFGHILGSHPEIAGYYEMHIGYHSPRSLVRQKLLYYRDHSVKPDVQYLFDKILHDYHEVNIDLMNQVKAKLIFSLREPAQTIRSIVALFRDGDSDHEYSEVESATEYYCARLINLKKMAERSHQFFYFQADDIRDKNSRVLDDVSTWLSLKTPLAEEFETFEYTGKHGAGDTSGNLEKRQVIRKNTDYSEIELPEPFESRAKEVYQQVTEYLREHAGNR